MYEQALVALLRSHSGTAALQVAGTMENLLHLLEAMGLSHEHQSLEQRMTELADTITARVAADEVTARRLHSSQIRSVSPEPDLDESMYAEGDGVEDGGEDEEWAEYEVVADWTAEGPDEYLAEADPASREQEGEKKRGVAESPHEPEALSLPQETQGFCTLS